MRFVGAFLSLLALLLLSACGGGTGDTVPDDDDGGGSTPVSTPTRTSAPATATIPSTPTPRPLDQISSASQISFQAGPADVTIPMFDESGRCVVNITRQIASLVGDFRGRPIGDVRVSFFVESGRGLLDGEVTSDASGVATATFRSLCPANSLDEITVVAALRGQEPFVDLNSNGEYDAGEPFTDLPLDAFLDGNRNGIYEPGLGEYLIWDANGNQTFDPGGNGVYDEDTVIFSEAAMIPVFEDTLIPVASVISDNGASRATFLSGSLEATTFVPFDAQGNCIGGTEIAVGVTASDQLNQSLPRTFIEFYFARGRGNIDPFILSSDETAVAEATFRNVCPVEADVPIVIVAALRGREPFEDLNGNDRHDPDEPFEDLPNEAFLDADRNGIYEPQMGDLLIYDRNGNGTYDEGSNGEYDDVAILTFETAVTPLRPTPTPTASPTDTSTPTETAIPTNTPVPTDTPTETPVSTNTPSATATATETATTEPTVTATEDEAEPTETPEEAP